MNEELVLVPEVMARRALRARAVRLQVLAPIGPWVGCGALRVLRLKVYGDHSTEVTAGYEWYERL